MPRKAPWKIKCNNIIRERQKERDLKRKRPRETKRKRERKRLDLTIKTQQHYMDSST